MGRVPEIANFEGLPLTSLRNLPSEFFSEDHNSYLPDTTITSYLTAADLDPTGDIDSEFVLSSSVEVSELGNNTLPVFAYRKEIADSVRDNPFTIVVAETGAGKSTQVPQFLLEAGWDHVYLTQPRRAAARNVFDRIRSEIGAVRGEHDASVLVSYQTAGEREGPVDARIKVVTDGLHLVRELHDGGMVENEVLIIDEVHEWNANVEVLTAWVKQAIAERPQLRVVMMSATMDANRLANYFTDVCPSLPPIIEIPGRTYHVERSEKPDSTVIEETLKAAKEIQLTQVTDTKEPNGILIFQEGKREIQDTIDEIRRRLPLDIAKTATILPLHAKLSLTEQQATFQAYPGIKIIVATNLAQTSLTIPDIKYVIDPGKERRVELDQEGVQGLMLNDISQADCDQRAGRTGRVSDGFYILTRSDIKTPYIPYIVRDKYPTPEIMRTDIVRNTLRIAAVGLDIATLDLYHPVDLNIIEQAQITLQTLGALDENNRITTMGRHMDQFPVCASSARMMVEANRYSEQTRAYLSAVVAAKEVGGLQYFGYNVGKRWKELTDETSSDLLSQLDIFIAIQDMTPVEMTGYNLDLHNIERAQEQYRKIAKQASALHETLVPPTPQEREDLKQCIYAGLVTSIYKYNGDGKYVHVGNPDTPREISNRSIVQGSPPALVGDAYRVRFSRGGDTTERHIIEHVTAATLGDLGRIATHLTEWKSEGLTLRGGRFMDVRRLSLFKVDLGVIEEVVAEPSPKLREAIIAHTLEHAGNYQNQLRTIKKQLEELAHLAKGPVGQLTHDQIVALVEEAAPVDITDPTIIDNNLRIMMENQGITLDLFVSAEDQERIIASAPSEIEVNGVILPVSYRSSRPLVRNFDPQDITSLTEEVHLEDGRQVYFIYKGKRQSLARLQEILSSSGS